MISREFLTHRVLENAYMQIKETIDFLSFLQRSLIVLKNRKISLYHKQSEIE